MFRGAKVLLAVVAMTALPMLPQVAAASNIHGNSLTEAYQTQTSIDFRKGLQIRLAWTGDYVGPFDGTVGPSTLRSIRDFQARNGLKATGIIDDGMLRQLVALSDGAENGLGVALIDDATTGAKLAIPGALVHDLGPSDVGNLWRSTDGGVEIETIRIAETGQTLHGLFDVLSEPTNDRSIASAEFGGKWFSLGGEVSGRRYVMRFEGRDDDLRGFSISYDEKNDAALKPFTVVAGNLFEPFADTPASELVVSNQHPSLSSILRRDRSVSTNARYAKANADQERPNLFEMPADSEPAIDGRGQAAQPAFDMAGSGFVVSNDGWVLTNAHVVRACHTVTAGGRTVAHRVVFDPHNDLALLKLDGVVGKPLPVSAGKPRLGEDILALGYPLRSILADSLNVTRGNVSSLLGLMNDPRYLQISAPGPARQFRWSAHRPSRTGCRCRYRQAKRGCGCRCDGRYSAVDQFRNSAPTRLRTS